jgi:hypothetical protein
MSWCLQRVGVLDVSVRNLAFLVSPEPPAGRQTGHSGTVCWGGCRRHGTAGGQTLAWDGVGRDDESSPCKLLLGWTRLDMSPFRIKFQLSASLGGDGTWPL